MRAGYESKLANQVVKQYVASSLIMHTNVQAIYEELESVAKIKSVDIELLESEFKQLNEVVTKAINEYLGGE